MAEYTLFASSPSGAGKIDLNKYGTDKLAIVFDAVPQHTITASSSVSSFAVESKAKKSDHIIRDNKKFRLVGYVTSSPLVIDKKNEIDKNTDETTPLSSRRPKTTLEILLKIRDTNQTVTLESEDIQLKGYAITSVEATRQTEEGDALVFSLDFEEMRTFTAGKTVLATTESIKAKGSADSKSTGVNKGNKTDADPDGDMLLSGTKRRQKTGGFDKQDAQLYSVPPSPERDKWVAGGKDPREVSRLTGAVPFDPSKTQGTTGAPSKGGNVQ